MFGSKKILRQILERLQALENAASLSAEKNAQSSEQVTLRLKELSGAANRHDMAIEDLLESWEELQEKQTQEAQTLASSLHDASAREQKEARARETALLNLLLSAHDQLFALQKAAAEAGAEGWLRQFRFAEQKLEETRLPAGFQTVEQVGVPVNYAVHEVVRTAPTQDAARDRLIADVDARGYVYLGRVLRKARVSVWRLAEPQDDQNGGKPA